MLSQYSWWDFFKVVGTGLIIYYAYVAWAYYREDIREWFSNRGQPVPVASTDLTQAEDEEPEPGSIFMVKDYSKPTRPQSTAPIPAPPIPVPAPVPASAPPTNTPSQAVLQPTVDDQASETQTDEEQANGVDVDLAGPALSDQPVNAFGFPLAEEPQSLSEQSVDEIISAAGRLTTDEQGMLSPIDADDQSAATVATVINNQQGRSVFADFSFTR